MLISQLPKHLEKWFCTCFNSSALAESKDTNIFIQGLKFGKFIEKICNENIIFEMVSIEVSTKFDAPFCFYISRLLRHRKKLFCTVFNSPAIAESKNIQINILDIKLANALTKV